VKRFEQLSEGSSQPLAQLIKEAMIDEGINVMSPEGQEIAASLLRQATLRAGGTVSRSWLRSRMAKEVIDAVEWIGLVIDEHGTIRIPGHWRRPNDALLNRFRLPRLAHRLANSYANRTQARRRSVTAW